MKYKSVFHYCKSIEDYYKTPAGHYMICMGEVYRFRIINDDYGVLCNNRNNACLTILKAAEFKYYFEEITKEQYNKILTEKRFDL